MQCLYVVYKNGWGKKQAVWNSTFCGNNFFLLNLQFRPAMLMPQGVWKTLTYINDLLERLKLNFSFCQLKVIISSNKILEHMLMQIYTHHILKTKTKNRDKAHEFRVAAVVKTAVLWSAVCSFLHLLRHSNVSWGFSDLTNMALNCFALGHVEKRYAISQLNGLILEGNKHKYI